MIHKMRLHNEPFELIANGTKTFELRLNDEKRRNIKVGDIIEFENRITHDRIETSVVSLDIYDSFEELYKHYDKVSIGYALDEDAKPSDMDLYYSKEEQAKYGVLAIGIKLLTEKVKEIVYNFNNILLEDVNNVVRRAKILIENTKGEILTCFCHNNYFFTGGHVEDEETDKECLEREILEEAGSSLPLDDAKLFMSIKYFNKDYPNAGDLSLYITNYYVIKNDFVPDLGNVYLTDDEKNGEFKLVYISKSDIISVLEESLATATRKNPVKDTIEVLKEYLK